MKQPDELVVHPAIDGIELLRAIERQYDNAITPGNFDESAFCDCHRQVLSGRRVSLIYPGG
jgi:hypothetical protein